MVLRYCSIFITPSAPRLPDNPDSRSASGAVWAIDNIADYGDALKKKRGRGKILPLSFGKKKVEQRKPVLARVLSRFRGTEPARCP
jgi:hypothetical protein